MKTLNNNSFAGCHFHIGVDTHLKNWRVTIRLDGLELKNLSMNPSPDELVNYLTKKYPGGTYHIVYEAGFCGFSGLQENSKSLVLIVLLQILLMFLLQIKKKLTSATLLTQENFLVNLKIIT